MKTGLLLVGAHGATASTLIAGLSSALKDDETFRHGSYWCALLGDFPLSVYSMPVSGWDYRFSSLRQAVEANAIVGPDFPLTNTELPTLPAILGPNDYAVLVEGAAPTHATEEDAISAIRSNIHSFRTQHTLDHVIVANLASPMRNPEIAAPEWSSISAYATATIEEGADWVEFTPSDSITARMIARSRETGSLIAGRDGSTGQTVMKLLLRDFLYDRGLVLQSWYSTNLIGNRDGLVLGNAEYNTTKIRDKKSVLQTNPSEHTSTPTHIVSINYIPPAGDNKEAWDCIHFSGWLDKKMSMRINWLGADSYLAAPLLLDIISGLIHARNIGRPGGVVAELGLFFKAPLLASATRFDQQLQTFKHFVDQEIAP